MRRLQAAFTPGADRGTGLLDLIISDYLAYYGPMTRMRAKWSVGGSPKLDSPRKLALLFLPRIAHNPCLHATLILRLALRSPRFTHGLWRTLLIAKHSIDISRDIEIGPGLLLPHPFGIGLGATVRLGRDVTILNSVSLGGNVALASGLRNATAGVQLCPVIGDDVIIFAQSILVGGITVGDRAVVAAGAWVDQDLPSRAIQPGSAALFRHFAASRPAG